MPQNPQPKMRWKTLEEMGSNVYQDGSWWRFHHRGLWCFSTLGHPPFLGKEIRIVKDEQNPISHYWTKLLHPGKVNVSEWRLNNRPDWFTKI